MYRMLPSLVLLFSAANILWAQPQLDKLDLFSAGQDGIALYRIPGIICTRNGTLLAYCEARRDSKSDWGEIEVHLRRSTDGGNTWSQAKHIAHLADRIEGNPKKSDAVGIHEQTVNNPVAVQDSATGDVVMLYCVNYARCFVMRSQDDGVTWSAPREITTSFEPFRQQYDWKVIATGPGHGVQLASGRLVVPIWLAYGKVGDHAPSAAGTIYSDDGGENWHAGDIAFPNTTEFENPNETMITVLSSGKVLLINRNVSKPNRKLVSTSDDGATNWSTPEFHAELWEPICMASVAPFQTQPGTLIFSNPHTLGRDKEGREIPKGRGKRENLTIKLSRDDGRTWPVSKTLESGPSAYSDLAVMPDGRVICLYEGNDKIVVARFNLEWIHSK